MANQMLEVVSSQPPATFYSPCKIALSTQQRGFVSIREKVICFRATEADQPLGNPLLSEALGSIPYAFENVLAGGLGHVT